MSETSALMELGEAVDRGLHDIADGIYDGLRIHKSRSLVRRDYLNVTDGLFAIAEAINGLSRAIRASADGDTDVES